MYCRLKKPWCFQERVEVVFRECFEKWRKKKSASAICHLVSFCFCLLTIMEKPIFKMCWWVDRFLITKKCACIGAYFVYHVFFPLAAYISNQCKSFDKVQVLSSLSSLFRRKKYIFSLRALLLLFLATACYTLNFNARRVCGWWGCLGGITFPQGQKWCSRTILCSVHINRISLHKSNRGFRPTPAAALHDQNCIYFLVGRMCALNHERTDRGVWWDCCHGFLELVLNFQRR